MSGSSTFIIAEIGVNHNGDVATAKKLIDVAKRSGADAVKFQTFKADLLANKNAQPADYQKESGYTSQHEMLQSLELTQDQFRQIKEYADEQKIEFISTPFDNQSVDLLDELNVRIFKVGSGDLTNYSLLKYIKQKGKDIILSSGMASMEEVVASQKYLQCPATILHCISSYPTPEDESNMLAILSMKKELPYCKIGFSDHTPGYHAAVMAVTLGAQCIEKHITLDKSMPGPDHAASLDPIEFSEFCQKIRQTERMLGDGVKRCMPCESENRSLVRRSLAAARDMKAGEILHDEDILPLRPATGEFTAEMYETLLGKQLLFDIQQNEFFQEEHLNASIQEDQSKINPRTFNDEGKNEYQKKQTKKDI